MLIQTIIFVLSCTLSNPLPSSQLIKGTEPLTCGVDEEPSDCVQPCLPTCDNPKTPPCFFKLCLGGCNCREGYIRETERGQCVKIDSCVNPGEVKRNQTVPKCNKTEMLSECASNCQATCDRVDVSGCTKLYCAHGCVCKHGYIRKDIGGSCIPVDKCK